MNCLKQCIAETKVNAYAHHIQRLMVLGDFALFAGVMAGYMQVNRMRQVAHTLIKCQIIVRDASTKLTKNQEKKRAHLIIYTGIFYQECELFTLH